MAAGDTTLFETLATLFENYRSAIRSTGPLRDGTAMVVREDERINAKKRFIEYRCRRYVRAEFLSGDNETSATLLTKSQQGQLDNLVGLIIPRFEWIEAFYLSDVYKDRSSKQRLAFPSNIDPSAYRRLVTWQILFGLVAVYYGTNVTGTATTLHSSMPLISPDWEERLIHNIERRLRILERLRYYVPGTDPIEPLVAFKYQVYHPLYSHTSTVGGMAPSATGICPDAPDPLWLGCTQDEGQRWSAWWQPVGFYPNKFQRTDDFELTECGKKNSFLAIERIFEKPSEVTNVCADDWKTANYCERVLHIIHLDDVASQVRRSGDAAVMENLASGEKIKIVHPWTADKEIIGSGNSDPDPANPSGHLYDPYYERKDDLRLDELIPGDHLEILNHPIYKGTQGAGAWQLENAIVTSIEGTHIPRDIQLKGHGLGPSLFADMQINLLQKVIFLHQVAQGIISGDFSSATPRTEAKKIQVESHWPSNVASISPYHLIISQGTIKPNSLTNAGIPLDYLAGLFANVEFRRELAMPGAFTQRDDLAFWFRWVTDYPYSRKDEWADEYKEWIVSAYRFERTPGEIRDLLHVVSTGLYGLPYINDVKLDLNNQKLILAGGNFSKDKIRGVYFVSAPRVIDNNNGTNSYAPGESGHSILGGYGVDVWNDADGLKAVGDSRLELPLPSASSSVEMTKTPGRYWKAVLKVNLFDPFRTSAAAMVTRDLHHDLLTLGENLTVGWYENLDESDYKDYKHIILKDTIAFLQLEIRAEFSFKWPQPLGGPIVEVNPASVQEARLDNDPVPILGHPFFNIVYAPVYREEKGGGVSEIRPMLHLVTDHLENFYRSDEPNSTIKCIRPRLDPSGNVPI